MKNRDKTYKGFGGRTFDEWLKSLTAEEIYQLTSHIEARLFFEDGTEVSYWKNGLELLGSLITANEETEKVLDGVDSVIFNLVPEKTLRKINRNMISHYEGLECE